MAFSKLDLHREIHRLLKLQSESKLTEEEMASRLFNFVSLFIDKPEGEESDGADDPLYEYTKDLISSLDQVTTSVLQDKFKIGYVRASRLIYKLEEDGLISLADGTSNPRKVL